MNELAKSRTIFVSVLGAIWSYIGIVAIPWGVLLVLNIIDYWTGISAAPYRNPEDIHPVKSYKSIHGIQKKVCMHLLIVIGWIIDFVIKTSIEQAWTPINYPPIFAIVIALWLTFNEIISILENMEDIGAPIPPFLLPIMKKMRRTVEDKVENKEDDK